MIVVNNWTPPSISPPKHKHSGLCAVFWNLMAEHGMRHVPVLLEATFSKRHAYVLCKALAKAQHLTMMLSNQPSAISCIARVTKRDGPDTVTDEAGNTPMIIRVMVFQPFSISGEAAEREEHGQMVRKKHWERPAFEGKRCSAIALAQARHSAMHCPFQHSGDPCLVWL